MIYHPTIIMLLSVIGLIFFYKKKRIFSSIALLMPIITAFVFYSLPDRSVVGLYNITLIYEASNYNKLIGTAFLLVIFSANLYALGQKRKMEIILGSSYGAFAFLCLLAGDFISVLVGLELMMIVSSILIFIGGIRSSLRSAKKYFLTHLMSSNMILIGVAHLITRNNDLVLVPITELLANPEYSAPMLYIMLVGMLINIAVFPFSGWMVNYYPKATPSGFLYLISFTTKVSIVLLIKLFSGYKPLEYIAVIMIIYASIKTLFEDNMLSLLCYLSIMAMGLMLIGISYGGDEVILATICYLFIHIIYKSLLSISIVSVIDQTHIYDSSNLKRINSKTIIAGLIAGIATMVNIPILSSFYIKSSISHTFSDSYIYFIILFLSFMNVLVIPWKQYFKTKEYFDIQINLHAKLSILFMVISLAITSILGKHLPILSLVKTFDELSIISMDVLKQAIIILSAYGLAIIWATKRSITKPINFTESIGDLIFYVYASWLTKNLQKEITTEPLSTVSLEKQAARKISSIHNQQTAIYIVFVMFIVMLMSIINFMN